MSEQKYGNKCKKSKKQSHKHDKAAVTVLRLRSLDAELLEIFIVRNILIDSLADDLLSLLAVLFNPLLILRLLSDRFLVPVSLRESEGVR